MNRPTDYRLEWWEKTDAPPERSTIQKRDRLPDGIVVESTKRGRVKVIYPYFEMD